MDGTGNNNNEDETEFSASEAVSRFYKAVKRQFGSGDGDYTPPVWDESEEYDFTNPRRGTMIIFNNENFKKHSARPGSSIDAVNLQATFTRLGFTVVCHHDKTKDQMLSILKKAAKSDHQAADCFACAVLSHGDQVQVAEKGRPLVREDLVYASDGIILTSDIVQHFTDNKCPSLRGKPRLFFIQACRGNQLDEGAEILVSHPLDEVDAAIDNSVQATPSPIYKDFLIMYATPPGFYAFRRPDSGSWMVRGLCEILARSEARKHKLTTLLTKVIGWVGQELESQSANLKITGKKQIPCFVSMLVKDIYFHNNIPGSPTMLTEDVVEDYS